MAQITAALVKELREKTGAGMMDCKNALVETAGDLEAAVDWLRKKGLAAAAKRAGRVAAEGLVAAMVRGDRGALVEVNAETDFVARNDAFQAFVRRTAELALDAGGDLEALKAATYSDGRTVAEEATHLIATIGENINLRRTAALAVSPGLVTAYVHGAVSPGLGRIGVLVALECADTGEALAALGKNLAMHVAASSPQAVDREGLDPALVERERAVLRDQARASGKPEQIVEKMVEGRLRKFFQDVVLMEQPYVIDPDVTVGQAVEAAVAKIGAPVRVAGFVRFALGEGVEKKESDFAAEVASLAG